MNDTIDQLEDWGNKVCQAIVWCQTNLTPGTWRYINHGEFDFDNDQDHLMFLLGNKL